MAEALLQLLSSRTGELFDPAPLAATATNGSVLRSSTTVAYLAVDPQAKVRLRLEAARLAWAARAGVPVPEVLELDPEGRWLLVVRVADDEVYGTAYVEAAVTAASVLATASEPLPVGAPRSRRASRAGLLWRAARAAWSPLDIAEFRRVREEVRALPADHTVHGDFHIGNVLSDAGRAVSVVDFEFLGRGVAGADLADLWTDLTSAADRDHLVDLALRARFLREQLFVLLHWSAVRHLADLVTPVPLRHRDRPEIELAVQRVAEARRLRRGG